MKNFTIYRDGNYDYKANAALKADALGHAAGRLAITGIKSLSIALLNASEYAIKGQAVSQDDLQAIGLK